MYNAPAKEIKIYFMPYWDGIITNEKLEYVNGKFVGSQEVVVQDQPKTINVGLTQAARGN